jgi:hypothetical protein
MRPPCRFVRGTRFHIGDPKEKTVILTDPNLEHTFETLKETNKRAAAEIAYALGELRRREGDYELMRWYRAESVRLFLEVEVNTEADAEAIYHQINGVWLPDLIHEGVVLNRLQEPD